MNEEKKTSTRPHGVAGTGIPVEKQATDVIRRVLDLAGRAYGEGDFELVLRLAGKAKSLRQPAPGLDYLRAASFYRLGQVTSAYEAVKEELRFFPDNKDARRLLQEIGLQVPKVSSGTGQPEADDLLKKIRPYTMVGEKRLRSLYALVRRTCELDIPGNLVECGVAAGGSSALIAAVAKRHSRRSRKVYCFDTFTGMPDPTEHDRHGNAMANETGWGSGTCAAPLGSLMEICSALDVQDTVIPVQGLFHDTLPRMRQQIGPIAFLHMDGDWYASTRDILVNLYDGVVPGGFVQVDDYGHWEGCKKALDEFFQQRNIVQILADIDGTGVWFSKEVGGISPSPGPVSGKRINLGCGKRAHPHWVNVDFKSSDPSVMAHDLKEGIPFPDASFDAVYHSHLLEHFPKSLAPKFIGECFRVLKPGGILRVVVPDLEQIARLYLELLSRSAAGDEEAQNRYEWILLELFDQMVRNVPGGDMLEYWKGNPMPAEDFVIRRMGSEILDALPRIRGSQGSTPGSPAPRGAVLGPREIGDFRLSGEIHQWMYDRYSLGRLLRRAGFSDVKTVRADESGIPDFNAYLLDIEANGSVRKPDSLFMEAVKPPAGSGS